MNSHRLLYFLKLSLLACFSLSALINCGGGSFGTGIKPFSGPAFTDKELALSDAISENSACTFKNDAQNVLLEVKTEVGFAKPFNQTADTCRFVVSKQAQSVVVKSSIFDGMDNVPYHADKISCATGQSIPIGIGTLNASESGLKVPSEALDWDRGTYIRLTVSPSKSAQTIIELHLEVEALCLG